MSNYRKILIVDDSRLARTLAKRTVSSVLPESVVLEADGGKDAIEAAEKEDFDLALVDFNMPEMNGLELISRLRGIQPGIKFILCTANIQSNMVEETAANGIGFIPKPISGDKLKEIVEEG